MPMFPDPRELAAENAQALRAFAGPGAHRRRVGVRPGKFSASAFTNGGPSSPGEWVSTDAEGEEERRIDGAIPDSGRSGVDAAVAIPH